MARLELVNFYSTLLWRDGSELGLETDGDQIFPVTYVEPLPEPTTAELQREAQEEAQVFASLGMRRLSIEMPMTMWLTFQAWWTSSCRP